MPRAEPEIENAPGWEPHNCWNVYDRAAARIACGRQTGNTRSDYQTNHSIPALNSPLRDQLKQRTRARHDAVEARFDRHDIATLHGLEATLRAHAIALDWCVAVLPGFMVAERNQLKALRFAASCDLRRLGLFDQTSPPRPDNWTVPHPLGLIYVIAGSRLGARVLLKRLAGSGDERVLAATAYLACPAGDDLWQSTRRALERGTVSPDEQTEIISAAETGFDWFSVALERVEGEPERL